MIRARRAGLLAVGISLVMAAAAMAQDDSAASTGGSGIGWRGWGVRVGLTADPDQVVAGFHFDLGEFTDNVWFQPDVVVGFGDDVTSVVGSFPVWYRFELEERITPYAGGALAVGAFRVDKKNVDETDVEIGLQIGGGAEWRYDNGRRFHTELRLDLIDVWDVYLIAGWSF